MADKDDDFEAELKKLESTSFDDEDDASSAMGGFPGDTGGFPDEEPATDEQDPFAGGFDDAFEDGFDEPSAGSPAEPDDAYPGDEDEAGEPDFDEAPDFEDEAEFDPEGEEGAFEEEGEVSEDDGDYAFDGDEDAGDTPTSSTAGKLILWGGLAFVGLFVGGAGWMVLGPALSGGNNTPPAAVSPLGAPAPEPFRPGDRAPAAIPEQGQPQGQAPMPPNMPGALPAPSGGERVQVPGYPANVNQEALRPSVTGTAVQLPNSPSPAAPPAMPELGRPALPTPVATQPQPSPTLPPSLPTPAPAAPIAVSQPPALPSAAPVDIMTADPEPVQLPAMPGVENSSTPALPGMQAELAPSPGHGQPVPEPVAVPEPKPTALPKAEAETNAVLQKMDALLARFADLEEKFVTEDDVSKMIDAAVAKVTISGGNEGLKAVEGTIEGLNERVASLQESLASGPATDEIVAQLEARFEQRFAALEAKFSSYEEVTEKAEEAEAKVEKAEEVAKKKADDTAKLKATVSRQKAEIVALKSKGRDYAPPPKPTVHAGYRLAGLSSGHAWIETPGGVSRFAVGERVPGLSLIKEFRHMDGNYVVIMENGIILP